ncbi:MAG: hypothetical protein ACMXYD_04775 [Candidatus Woesearchaeota archaeon]
MNNLTHAKENPYMIQALSDVLPNLRKIVLDMQEQQRKNGTLGAPKSQRRLADIIDRYFTEKRTSLLPHIHTYKDAAESSLAKLFLIREDLTDKYLEQNNIEFRKQKFVTFRYKTQEGQSLLVPDIPVESARFVRERDALQYISNNLKTALPGKLLVNKEERNNAKLTMVLNKTLYFEKGARVPLIEIWGRGKLQGERKTQKDALYIVGGREDLANDNNGMKMVYSSVAHLCDALEAQVDRLRKTHDLYKAIDIKGKDIHKKPLSLDNTHANRKLIRESVKYAQELNKEYLTQPNPIISPLHKDQMMLMYTFDHKFANMAMESQYVHAIAHDIMENGCLSHGDYEIDRHLEDQQTFVDCGVNLVMQQIYNSTSNFFTVDELILSKLPKRTN